LLVKVGMEQLEEQIVVALVVVADLKLVDKQVASLVHS